MPSNNLLNEKCSETNINSSEWVREQVENVLPTGWKKFVCHRNNKAMRKLTKYVDPSGNQYRNLQSAVDACQNTGFQRQSAYQESEKAAPNYAFNNSVARNMNFPESNRNVQKKIENFSCKDCKLTYPNVALLDIHINEKHSSRNKTINEKTKFQCNLCNKIYKTQVYLDDHKNQEHSKTTTSVEMDEVDVANCNLCNMTFDTKEELKSHNTSYHLNFPAKSISSISVSKQNISQGKFVNNFFSQNHGFKSNELVPLEFDKFLTERYSRDEEEDELDEVLLPQNNADNDIISDDDDDVYIDMDMEKTIPKLSVRYPTTLDKKENLIQYNLGSSKGDIDRIRSNEIQFYSDDDDDLEDDEIDEIEVISKGVKKIPHNFGSEIEVVQERTSGREVGIERKNQPLDSFQQRYKEISITSSGKPFVSIGGDVLSDMSDDDSDMDEDPEEITLDEEGQEPEEITVDEDDDEDREELEAERKKLAEAERKRIAELTEVEELKKIQTYERMISEEKYVKDVIEDDDKLRILRENVAWYAKPPNWRPKLTGPTEWYATVAQICDYFSLKPYPIKSDWSFENWDTFSAFISDPLEFVNKDRSLSQIYKLKKAMWFEYLNPSIPKDTSIMTETLDDDEVE